MAGKKRLQVKVNNYETLMQRVVALGLSANYIARACPDRLKNCKDAAIKADDLLKQFRELPKWKKWIFNRLFHD